MAKKRKKSQHKRRVGAIHSKLNARNPMVKLAAVGVGFLLADPINNMIDKANPSKVTPATATTPATTAPTIPTGLVTGAEVGIGTLLLMHKKGGLIGTGIGGLLAGAGLKRVALSLGIIKPKVAAPVNPAVSGYQSVPVIGSRGRRMAGYQSVPVIGSYVPGQLQGNNIPGQLQGANGYVASGSGPFMNGSGITRGNNSGYMQ